MKTINTNKDLTSRFSPKIFLDKEIEQADFLEIMEAARWAPSAFNEQPWRFIYARKGSAQFEDFVAALMPGNQDWAKDANILMFLVSSTTFKRNDKQNRHAWYDAGQAAANLSQAAWDRGIGVHQMAGFHADKAREVTGTPEQFDIVAAIAMGYFDENEKERSRMDLSEILFENQFS